MNLFHTALQAYNRYCKTNNYAPYAISGASQAISPFVDSDLQAIALENEVGGVVATVLINDENNEPHRVVLDTEHLPLSNLDYAHWTLTHCNQF